MHTVKIDFEDAQALAINLEEHLQYEIDTDHTLWAALHQRLIQAIENASETGPKA